MTEKQEKKDRTNETQVSCRVPDATANKFLGMLRSRGITQQDAIGGFIDRVLQGKELVLLPGEAPPKMPSKKDLEKDPVLAATVQRVVRMFIESPIEFGVLRMHMDAWEQSFEVRKTPT
jgi:hypothetical protein